MNLLLETLYSVLRLVWLVIPLALLVVFRNWWVWKKTTEYMKGMEWVLLEISIPKENLKSAKAMEQVVTALHVAESSVKKKDLYLKGKVEDWFSLEIAGFADGVHFYIRTLKDHRTLVESALLSQYPDAEILEAEDYTERLKEKPFQDRDIFGTDIILKEKDFLPIRTYEQFEDAPEEHRIDPIATITEVMSSLEKNEALWIQLLIRPTGTDWRKAGEEHIDELLGVKKDAPKTVLSQVMKDAGEVVGNMPGALFSPPTYAEEDKKDDKGSSKPRSSVADDKMKAVGRKLSRPAFQSILRIVYIDDKDEFTNQNVTAVMGALAQLGDQNMNWFTANKKATTSKGGLKKLALNKSKKLSHRKKLVMLNYIERAMPKPVQFQSIDLYLETSIMTPDEIATVFHPPTDLIKSERIKEIHSRKSQAPVDLPLKE